MDKPAVACPVDCLDMPDDRIKLRLIVTVAVAAIIVFSLFSPFASATTAGPKVCLKDGSGSTTSSDGSAYAAWAQFVCSGRYEGQSSYEAFSGQKYVVSSGTITLCGQQKSLVGDDDFSAGTAGSCYWYLASNFALNQGGGYTYPFASGSLTIETVTWSGNCATVGPGPCYASITS